jgi:hypothetical protein
MPVLSNPETSDPRRRSLVYAYSGARHFVSGTPRSAAMDPTALLSELSGKLGDDGMR